MEQSNRMDSFLILSLTLSSLPPLPLPLLLVLLSALALFCEVASGRIASNKEETLVGLHNILSTLSAQLDIDDEEDGDKDEDREDEDEEVKDAVNCLLLSWFTRSSSPLIPLESETDSPTSSSSSHIDDADKA